LTDNSSVNQAKASNRRAWRITLFAVLALLWLLIDIGSKSFFESRYETGTAITDSIIGLFRFYLVHNTGAAWGMFGDSTFFLGIMSCVICVLLLVYFFVSSKHLTKWETFGLALVFAGGLGNAIDRFSQGYVIDFIEFTFIDFPVFNVADIGVTCGFVIFILAFFVREHKRSKELSAAAAAEKISAEESPNPLDKTAAITETVSPKSVETSAKNTTEKGE